MATFAQPAASFKYQASRLLDKEQVERICQAHGHSFRDTTLTPAETVGHFAWQVAMGNVSLDAVRHHADGKFSASAYCQARQRLPLAVLEKLSEEIAQVALARAGSQEPLWMERRVFRIDGTGIALPDAPEVRKHFGCSGKQKPGCGYPTMHLLLLTGPGGVAVKTICSPLRTGDMTHAGKMNDCLQAGDILLGDGLFGGWGHLQQLQSQQLDGVFPAHHSRKIGFGRKANSASRRFVKSLGYQDQLVEYRKPGRRPKWMSVEQFKEAGEWLLVREVRRRVKIGGVGREMTLVTTLSDAKAYPAKALVKLLGERWAIEVNLRSLKTTMGLETLRCQSVEGVRKELLTYLIVYNLVRLWMLEAAQRQNVPLARISFADALARLRWGVDLQTWVDLEVNPDRPDRIEPRVVKRRPKAFATMTKPRKELRRLLTAKRKKKAA